MERNLQDAVLRVLCYFHYFKYPITAAEIHRYTGVKCSKTSVDNALTELVARGVVFNIGDFYSPANEHKLVERRIAGNAYAAKRMRKAKRIAFFLAQFPFVEAVCISGSLSKDFLTTDGDMDFFIMTTPGRLWIARTLLHLFKKLTFLVGAQHSFCMNYFLDAEQSAISPKNFFTAIETATLKPVFVRSGISSIYNLNKDWIKVYLPNDDCAELQRSYMHEKSLPARMLEVLLNLFGDRLNNFLFRFTRSSWIKKWKRKNFDVVQCLKCMDKHVNTPVNYPINFPDRVMEGYERVYEQVVEQKPENFTVV